MNRPGLLLAPMALLLLAGCDDDDTTTDPHEHGAATLELRLAHQVSGADLAFNELTYTTAEGNTYSVQNLEYILGRVTLESATTRSVEVMNAHYVDGFVADTHTLTLGDLAEDTYTGVSFTFGLDEEMNLDPDQGGDMPTTDEWTSMRWLPTWGGGYHYMKLEGRYLPDGETHPDSVDALATHTGRRYAQDDPTFGTDPDPIPHFFEVTLPFATPLTVGEGDAITVEIVMDLNQWYTDPHDFDLDAFPGMIMMNTAAQDLLEANGATVFSLGEVSVEHGD